MEKSNLTDEQLVTIVKFCRDRQLEDIHDIIEIVEIIVEKKLKINLKNKTPKEEFEDLARTNYRYLFNFDVEDKILGFKDEYKEWMK